MTNMEMVCCKQCVVRPSNGIAQHTHTIGHHLPRCISTLVQASPQLASPPPPSTTLGVDVTGPGGQSSPVVAVTIGSGTPSSQASPSSGQTPTPQSSVSPSPSTVGTALVSTPLDCDVGKEEILLSLNLEDA